MVYFARSPNLPLIPSGVPVVESDLNQNLGPGSALLRYETRGGNNATGMDNGPWDTAQTGGPSNGGSCCRICNRAVVSFEIPSPIEDENSRR